MAVGTLRSACVSGRNPFATQSVGLVRDNFQMLRVNTAPNATEMIQLLPTRDWATQMLENNAVG